MKGWEGREEKGREGWLVGFVSCVCVCWMMIDLDISFWTLSFCVSACARWDVCEGRERGREGEREERRVGFSKSFFVDYE